MQNILNWIKQNKLTTLLIIVVGILILGRSPFNTLNNLSVSRTASFEASPMAGVAMDMAAPAMGKIASRVESYAPVAPQAGIPDRMVVQNSYLSLVVKDVTASIKTLTDYITGQGGYMVNSNISRPEEGGTGTLTLRVPSHQLETILENFKSQSVKVVSQNLQGTDVTDQFVNNEERLRILERNKARFEEIMAEAVKIDEILRVQQEIFSLQSQIDSIKGQQEYLKKTSEMALLTVYLSTDELALPYAPVSAFRPEVVFKQAVRHLMGTLQSIASLAIWIGVYSIVWLPIVLVVYFIRRRNQNRLK